MTENEAIKVVKTEKECVVRNINEGCDHECWNCDLLMPDEDNLSGHDIAIQALEEIQQYRAIGTVDECRAAVERMKLRSQICI